MKCYKHLLKYDKAVTNVEKLKKELKDIYTAVSCYRRFKRQTSICWNIEYSVETSICWNIEYLAHCALNLVLPTWHPNDTWMKHFQNNIFPVSSLVNIQSVSQHLLYSCIIYNTTLMYTMTSQVKYCCISASQGICFTT
jgi:hypothetical protein